MTEALRHGRGAIGHEELKGRLRLEESSKAIVRDGNQVATARSLQREREMIDSINRGVGAFSRVGGTNRFVASETLRPEQKHAIQVVLDSPDRESARNGILRDERRDCRRVQGK